ncbi:MAG TPA: electron transfer flavoprotein subunit alpha/FixB family protein [Vicinamibacterales bacterium]
MVLVIAEQRDGAVNRASWEAIAAAQQLAGDAPVVVAVAGASAAGAAAELAAADVREVVVLESPALQAYTADGWVLAHTAVIADTNPEWVVLPHTYQTRDFAPALAARLDRTLVTDCTAVRRDGGSVVLTRPMYQGKLAADVRPLGEPPWLLTCQIGAFRADAARRGAAPAPVRTQEVAIDAGAIRQQPEAPFREAKQAVDLSQAERIVAVGRGIKGPEHLPLAQQLAEALGAEVAASRPICDAGWLPMERQIGSSGQTVAPKLYVAVGISGAIQHVVGMKGARTIVAINKDPEAPIFEVADYGYAGDLFEFLPAFTAALRGS